MLTAKDSEIDKVLGLELGADDYVTKPFSNRELIARVKANLRRQQQVQEDSTSTKKDIHIGNITIHPDAYSVSREGEHIDLTHREFELFYYLARHIGQVMTREDLLETVWGYDYFGDVRTVDVTVRRLREKIEDDPSNPAWIVTRRECRVLFAQSRRGVIMYEKGRFLPFDSIKIHYNLYSIVGYCCTSDRVLCCPGA